MEKAGKSTCVVKCAPAGDEERGMLSLRSGGEHLRTAVQPQQEMAEDSEDKAMIQQGQQALMNHNGDIEAGRDPSNLPVIENGESSTAIKEKNKKLKHHDLKLAFLLVTLSAVPLIDILFLRGSANKLPLKLKLAALFAFTAFVAAISLMFHTLKLMTIKPEHIIPKNQLKLSKVLLTISISSFILTCISITYSLLPKAYFFLPIALIPSILAGAFHFISFIQCNKDVSPQPQETKILKKALKSATQLTLSLVTTSFSGFIGDLIGIHHKAESLGHQYSYAKVSIYLMLGSGLAGILALLFCRLLSYSNNNNEDDHRREIWRQKTILVIANTIMLSMLVPALLLIAVTILHGLVVPAAVFPVIAGAAAWLFIELCTAGDVDDGDGHKEDEKDGKKKAEMGTMYAVAVAVASVSFGAILAVFGGLLGGAVGKGELKVCTFFLTSAFIAAVSLGVVASVAPARKASVVVAATVLACCGLGTLVLAALALFYQIGA
uniref:Uncharacterized protein n=1 Tax=Leersia perrieri TaxID=77586 RepID=A0A0D9WT59_9ORYZ